MLLRVVRHLLDPDPPAGAGGGGVRRHRARVGLHRPRLLAAARVTRTPLLTLRSRIWMSPHHLQPGELRLQVVRLKARLRNLRLVENPRLRLRRSLQPEHPPTRRQAGRL